MDWELKMKTSNVSEFVAVNTPTISFKSLSSDELDSLLLPFYLNLDFDARRARFGCAVSDDSIIRHCRGLNLSDVEVLGCVGPTGLIAAVELHPLSPTWEDAELALTEATTTNKIVILGHLLQLAAFAAGKRGCNALVIHTEPSEPDLLRLLRGMGRIRAQWDIARVDIAEYALIHSLSVARV
jgi:hypothetical protein